MICYYTKSTLISKKVTARFIIGNFIFLHVCVYMYTHHGMSMVYGGAVDNLERFGYVYVCVCVCSEN